MGQWIEQSEREGRLAGQKSVERRMAEQAAREAFRNELVDEEAVKKFLEPLKLPMVQVQTDLEASGYKVEDLGYRYNKMSAIGVYAVVHRENHLEAYGQVWTIDTPEGQQLDTLRLFPFVSDTTHFSVGHYSLLSGGGRIVKPTDDRVTVIDKLQNLIGARIKAYYESGPKK